MGCKNDASKKSIAVDIKGSRFSKFGSGGSMEERKEDGFTKKGERGYNETTASLIYHIVNVG